MEKDREYNNGSSSDFIPESKENIILGAKIFSEKASDIFNKFLEKIKDTAETAYEKGADIVESVSLTAQNYIEKYKDRSEISSLTKVRNDVATQLGNMCYMEYSGRYKIRVEFLKSEEFKNLIAQISELDKQIIAIGERFEEEK